MKTKHLIGIDPATNSGWAIVSIGLAPRLLSYGEAEMNYDVCPTDLLRDAMGSKFGPCIVGIEEQYVGVNARTSLVVARRAGRWEEAAAMCGCTPTFVNPQTWHSRELGITRPRDVVKRAAVNKVKGLYKIKVSSDVADAILIARYCAVAVAAEEM